VALPDALLVTPAGDSNAFFPALEYTSTSARVLHLTVRAHVPSDSGAQDIRLYRNGREDVLFTAPGVKTATVERDVIVDALPGDRFLVAVEPTGLQGGSAALQFFVSSRMGESFPSACQLAASFSAAAAGDMIEDLCTNRDLASLTSMSPGASVAPMLISGGPFPELGKAIDLAAGRYLKSPDLVPLVRQDTPVTIQLWVRVDTVTSPPGSIFDDLDPDLGGGSSMIVFLPAAPQLEVSAYSSTTPQTTVRTTGPFTTGTWHFLRVVDANGTTTVCVDGARLGSFEAPANRPSSINPVFLGKSAQASASAIFDGAIDDVRVFSAALPCD